MATRRSKSETPGLDGVDDLLSLRRVLAVAHEALGFEVVELLETFRRTACTLTECLGPIHAAQRFAGEQRVHDRCCVGTAQDLHLIECRGRGRSWTRPCR